MTPREIVYKTLAFDNPPRVPRQLWTLPWAHDHYKADIEDIEINYPSDIIYAPGFTSEPDPSLGDLHEVGEAYDAWACHFVNYQKGIIGEVKDPIVTDDTWTDTSRVHIPREWLTINVEKINAFCSNTDKFVITGACARPFEQLQFIRGTENLYMDLMFMPEGLKLFIQTMHEFYCELLEKWAETDVDAIMIMDDWGAQNSLLINPKMWVEIFKPLYKDYIDIAHKHGKKIFMHSDGYVLDIYPHLIEMGLDAFNSQVFCMGIDQLEDFAGQITFWGEIDRQHLLPNGTEEDIERAVQEVKAKLWKNGGCIAQCEFGPGANPNNVRKVFQTWGND